MRKNNNISFQFMTGMADNEFIHTIYVYGISQNKIIYKKEYCQSKLFKPDTELSCDEESVNEFAELKLLNRDLKLK